MNETEQEQRRKALDAALEYTRHNDQGTDAAGVVATANTFLAFLQSAPTHH